MLYIIMWFLWIERKRGWVRFQHIWNIRGRRKIDFLTLEVKLTLRAEPLPPPPNVNPVISFQIQYRTTSVLTTVFSDCLLKWPLNSRTAHQNTSIQFTLNTKILSLHTICRYTYYLYPQSSIENATSLTALPLWPPWHLFKMCYLYL